MTLAVERDLEQKIWTDEAFMALPDDGSRYEIVNGVLVNMGNSGIEHGYIASILNILVGGYVLSHKLGIICDSSTAFKMKAGNKRAPDLSFVSKMRLKGVKRLPKGFFEGAPDLAVEVISPSNTFEELHYKIVEYFENGCHLVWVIHPDEQSIMVYYHPHPDRLLKINDVLDGEQVIPGFTLPVADLFAELDF
jgi:Uma2 family endonuclease